MWSIGGAVVLLSPLLSAHQTRIQIERFGLSSIVTSSGFASILLDMMKNDPTAMPTLSSFVLVVMTCWMNGRATQRFRRTRRGRQSASTSVCIFSTTS